MKKYKNRTLLLFIIYLGFCNACSDSFLDEDILDAYTPETLDDKLGVEASAIGLYNLYSLFFTKSDQQGWLSVWQVGTDIVWPGQVQGVEVPFYNYEQLNPDNSAVRTTWRFYYDIIENANIIINVIDVRGDEITDLTAEEKLAFSAEAKFFRALAYNGLATLYGGVPLVTEPLTEPRTDFVRAPLSDINGLIESDLTFATENLPEVDQARAEARVNRYTAHHLFAEYYLRTNQGLLAEEQANAIINSGKYALVNSRYGVEADQPGDPFSDMFFVGNLRRSQGNTEAIWVLENENPGDVRDGSTGFPQHRRIWVTSYHSRNQQLPADSLGGRGIIRIRLNNWVIYDLYEPGDMRNSRYNLRREFYYNNPNNPNFGQLIPYEGPDTLLFTAPYTTKWKQFDPRDVFGFGMWKDFMLMRLGETYLFKAEAQLQQGNIAGAAETINILRTRANAPLVNPGDIDLDFILDERVRELLAEENRRMTLMRTGTLVERNRRLNGGEGNLSTTGLADTHLLFPIPLREIQLNRDAVLEQNRGYEAN